MIRAVFFDLGNTLVDWNVFYSKEADELDLEVLASFGCKVSLKKIQRIS